MSITLIGNADEEVIDFERARPGNGPGGEVVTYEDQLGRPTTVWRAWPQVVDPDCTEALDLIDIFEAYECVPTVRDPKAKAPVPVVVVTALTAEAHRIVTALGAERIQGSVIGRLLHLVGEGKVIVRVLAS